ncbi:MULTISPECIES: dihydroorotate dehydrogenase [Thermodesulfovibrio]|uniref:Dihydroorotate dehydrogenase B (NAD(+)), catalytic subunit n=1 Tax=Thermodesulfovibrio yellowstonii (strain ATCC 51303 / DSM 11347 / YP87) TaxID=289376 RepID=PYRDB_THEYD|nr:RecName: Full=Dihydroorotate dehydrogenase B (NAD(+)), catalytic subunit; Short=DHOD B; Short=DHODase B; Short=DHOdehase B; AltName: Full=Dihydroorotate oxidase B; AltName: Full=Orotate reductase (NADH) [Thermodesulfovibrio yellowstonii DSM 11347]ACI20942.1 dihydroorotate dehydrogenase, catalytic subunit [Thermodesulfovibrio yellowstonii DSM 11347]
MPVLEVKIGNLSFKNPVLTASGTFGYGLEYSQFVDLNILGGIVVKGLSLKPKQGNPPPRIYETPCGMINSIGLQNIGLEAFKKEKLPFLKKFNTNIIVNFFGENLDEYIEVAKLLDETEGVHALEMNVSCPNKTSEWRKMGLEPELLREAIKRVRLHIKKPLIVKLAPQVTEIALMARICEEEGADAVSLINTIPAMVIDIKTRKSMIGTLTGGLSGPAIRPVALRAVWEVAQAVKIPVIGVGGIVSAEDALQFLIAGAKAIQVGTANFINPIATVEIIEGIKQFLIEENIKDINEIIGSFKE